MEPLQDQSTSFSSPLKHSYLGSFHRPPDRISSSLFAKGYSTPDYTNQEKHRSQQCPPPCDSGSKVITALRNLQDKMRRLELERVHAEDNARLLSETAPCYPVSTEPTEGANMQNKNLLYKLQSTEARCKLLEKQLDYMRMMVKKAEQDRLYIDEKQKASLTDQADIQMKLEKLERECLELTSTQSVSQKKMELLEQKVLEEERARRVVREKTDELQRDLEADWGLQASASTQVKQKKGKARAVKNTIKCGALTSPHSPKAKLPFITGTSTSPSHSVHANFQSILHMMKHHQPQLRDQVHPSVRPALEAGRGACKALLMGQGGTALDSLSELLLALQDELGQMSFEHQDLVMQIKETQKQEVQEDLERELDCLVKRMEDKGAQIGQLRKHQAQVEKLKQKAQALRRNTGSTSVGCVKEGVAVRPLAASLPSGKVLDRPQHKGKRKDVQQSPKRPQRLHANLKRCDVAWEV